MLEPDLTVRAQRAAAELERAWQRWRAMQNPGTESLPPVSSFLGYSMEDPWGQPRVVFGIAASDAEQLTALLDRRDAAGSVYAAMTSRSAARPEQSTNGSAAAAAERGIAPIHVPSQTKPAAAQRAAAQRAAAPAADKLSPLDPPLYRDIRRDATERDVAQPEPEAAAQESQTGLGLVGFGPAAGLEDQDLATRSGVVAFRPRHGPESYGPESYEPESYEESGVDPAADAADVTDADDPDSPADAADLEDLTDPTDPTDPTEAGQAGQATGWTRSGRLPGSHGLPRAKRSGAGKRASNKQEGKDRAGLADIAAELAGWAASELPGQASQRRGPRPSNHPDRPALG
jgi:hypothetical protein